MSFLDGEVIQEQMGRMRMILAAPLAPSKP